LVSECVSFTTTLAFLLALSVELSLVRIEDDEKSCKGIVNCSRILVDKSQRDRIDSFTDCWESSFSFPPDRTVTYGGILEFFIMETRAISSADVSKDCPVHNARIGSNSCFILKTVDVVSPGCA